MALSAYDAWKLSEPDYFDFEDVDTRSDEQRDIDSIEATFIAHELALGLICWDCHEPSEVLSCGLCPGCWAGQRCD